MPFLLPNQQRQSTEGIITEKVVQVSTPSGIWNCSWKYWKSTRIQLMVLENFIISNVIFAHQAIFSTLYIGKSSGKQDHYDLRHSDQHLSELIITCLFIDITNFTCILILYGLSCKNLLEVFKNVSWKLVRLFVDTLCLVACHQLHPMQQLLRLFSQDLY